MPLTFDDLPRLRALATGDEKHARSTTSTLDVLWVLYDRVLRIDPADPDDPQRDRFVLSKGHGPTSYYAVLAAKDFIAVGTLADFASWESSLGLHPDRLLVPGVEASSGSLGHGLPIAIGIALSLRSRQNVEPRVFCLLGDGEFDEGSVHEAIAYAGRRGLDNLVAIAIDNESSRWGWPSGMDARFAVEGWQTTQVDSQDHAALESAFTARPHGAPHAVVVSATGLAR